MMAVFIIKKALLVQYITFYNLPGGLQYNTLVKVRAWATGFLTGMRVRERAINDRV